MTLRVHLLRSRALRDNPLGDPAVREVHVYTPPGYDPARPYPALLALAGFTGTGAMLFNRDPLGEALHERLDRLILTRRMPPVVVAAPDCMNRLGGSQYLNSPAIGRYEDHVVKEVLPFVGRLHRISRWGVFGKSSGGYGAMVLGMRHPDLFSALADHSGDAGFELAYLPDFPAAMDRWRAAGGPARWLASFWKDPNRRRRAHLDPLNMLAMSAHYSPNPRSPHLGIDFPFDLETGEFRPGVWRRWRAWDPVNLVPRHARALRGMRLVYVDCGDLDEFRLHWGNRALAAALRRHGVKARYETFPDGHMNVSYRYDRSLPLLAKALSR